MSGGAPPRMVHPAHIRAPARKQHTMPSIHDIAPPPFRSEGVLGSNDPARAPHALWIPNLGEVAVQLFSRSLWSNDVTEVQQTGRRRVLVCVPADENQRPLPTRPEHFNAQHNGCLPGLRAMGGWALGIAAGFMSGLSFAVTAPAAVAGLVVGSVAAMLLSIALIMPNGIRREYGTPEPARA